jgi:hypothetical protein
LEIRRLIVLGSRLAGPMVQTIFVLLMQAETGPGTSLA